MFPKTLYFSSHADSKPKIPDDILRQKKAKYNLSAILSEILGTEFTEHFLTAKFLTLSHNFSLLKIGSRNWIWFSQLFIEAKWMHIATYTDPQPEIHLPYPWQHVKREQVYVKHLIELWRKTSNYFSPSWDPTWLIH